MRTILVIPVLLSFITVLSCSDISGTDCGGGTRTGNPVVIGKVVDFSGAPVKDADVRIRNSNFIDTSKEGENRKTARINARTDESGKYVIQLDDTGCYTVEINDRIANAVMLRCFIAGRDTTVDFGRNILGAYTSIAGRIENVLIDDDSVFIQLNGLERHIPVNEEGFFHAGDIPEGTYALRVVDSDFYPLDTIDDSITVYQGTTVNLPFLSWSHSREIYLNTTASGAGITSDIYDFPVLIRLSESMVDFTQFGDSGRDLRFSKADGTELLYETEQWNPEEKRAAVWVMVDTIKGNNADQYIRMHWGNPGCRKNGNKNFVFDSTGRFSAVWHLNSVSCKDASPNNRHGVSHGTYDIQGLIGGAQKFSGDEYIQINGLIGTPGSVTLSAWFSVDSIEWNGAEILSIGDYVLIRAEDNIFNRGALGSCYIGPVRENLDSLYSIMFSGLFYKNSGWHFIAFSIDSINGVHKLYIDGQLISVKFIKSPAVYKNLGMNTYIGRNALGLDIFNFSGMIDEVRVCRTTRSGDWIRLCYMNQRKDDKLIIIKPESDGFL